MTFRAPVEDLLFCLTQVVGAGQDELDADTLRAVLEGAGQLAEGTLAPLNRIGDAEGARLENGRVRTASGFADAYRAYAEGGWPGLSADPAYGGQGLPKTLACAVFETLSAANTAFCLCPLLSAGAAEAIHAHGTERQKTVFLPRLASGEWTGTMQLTEPQAGSDLGALTSRAEPDGEGGYRLFGQKIFITWGDHDLADNIVHLVLARLPGAPAGSRGISLFVTSKRRVEADGSLGLEEAVHPVGLEHKLGVHASPTCTMSREGARAELVGRPNEGLAHIAAERRHSGRRHCRARLPAGAGLCAGATAGPLRLDGRGPGADRRSPRCPADAGPDEGQDRGGAGNLPRHRRGRRQGPRRRSRGEAAEEVLTPIAKAWSTDMAVETASLGVQVHGGAGFIEETGAAQHYRDARIPPIYEGTNGIQAIDLAGRKLGMAEGAGVKALAAEARAAAVGAAELSPLPWRLRSAADWLEAAAERLYDRRGTPDALAGATPFLQLCGDVLGGAFLAKGALAAAKTGHASATRRAALARLYAEQVLSHAPALAGAAMQGAEPLEHLP